MTSDAAIPTLPSPPQRLSRPAALAALIAVGALFSTSPALIGLPLLAALILASQLVRWRLPNLPLLIWTLRLGLFLWALLSSGFEGRSLFRWYLKSEYTNLLGMIGAIELTLRCWQPMKKNARGDVMLLSGLVFVAACNTFDAIYMRWLAPAFVIAILMSFRDFRPRVAPVERRWRPRVVRSVFLAAMLGMGVCLIFAVQYFGNLVDKIRIEPILRNPAPSQVGMSAPNLGSSANPRPSPVRILRVEGLAGEAHLRGASFDIYDQGRWGLAIERRRFEPAGAVALNSAGRGARMLITRLVEERTLIFAPLEVAGINPVAGDIPTWDPQSRIVRGANRGVTQYQYEAILATSKEHQGPLCGPLDASVRRQCLDVPTEIDPRVVELARQITKGLNSPRDKALALEQFLQANIRYSLEVRPGNGDRVSDFVLNRRPAHCQYFASALVIMLRAVGVPARIVTGYYAHESAGDKTVIVRQRDAHAWTEAWIDGTGWVSLDATPGSGRPDRAYESVSSARKFWEWLTDTWAKVADWLGGLGVRDVLLALAGVAAVAIAGQWLRLMLKRRRREKQRKRDSAYPEGELGALAERFERLLREAGAPLDPALTWREQAARSNTIDAPRARAFLLAYDQARFGPADGDLSPVRQALSQLQPTSTPK